MTFFNHEIEYLPTYRYDGLDSLYEGMEIRTAIVSYDNHLGMRCKYRFDAPAHLWTDLRVGGVASAGGVKTVGIVSKAQGRYCHVQTPEAGESEHEVMPPDELAVGQQVVIFDSMRHDPGCFGEFIALATPRLDIAEILDVHSINLLINQDGTRVGTIHIDPFINQANYDEFEVMVGSRRWRAEHFSYKQL